jgi:hypothetical protein
MFGVMVAGVLPALPARSAGGSALRLDFGGTTPAPADGYLRALATHNFTTARGWGWTSTSGLAARDRGGPGPITRDFVFGVAARVFRIANLTPGRYRLTIITGDLSFGDHTTRIRLPGIDGGTALPVLKPDVGQFATVTATLVIPTGNSTLDITFETPEKNWVVSGLILEPVSEAERMRVTVDIAPPVSTWGPVLTWDDPTAALLSGHRGRVANAKLQLFRSTGLTRADYLTLIAGEVDFWKTQQNPTTGAIIDPYRGGEFQYSTPAFAHAAAALVAYAGREDLIEAAALALDWSARTLSARKAASGHEDFFAPMIAHSIRLLKPFVPAERAAAWEYDIWYFEPFLVYRYQPGVNNWNVVAASGEALFQMMGIRDAGHRFAEASFARQGRHFRSPYGLYLEGPMAYDHFPRLWLGDLLARGYNGPYHQELGETLRRGAITSLFMQSPTGELPAGGRSAHHQWNEAQQCVTFEIYAARALAAGDADLAAYFKRAARLSLGSMRRWVRPSGEMQIVKNWVDPAEQHGYETYSAHSQYNLLPMSMLAIAFEHAESTEVVAELPAPADLGGFVLHLEELHKVFANAGGAYVEVETAGDHAYDATGLIRAHFAGHSPQLGPSDSVLAAPKYIISDKGQRPATTGVGVAWLGADGAWRHLGELTASQIGSAAVQTGQTGAERVTFSVRYTGDLGGGVGVVEEQFALTPDAIEVTTLLPGFTGPVRRVVPVLADDGRTKCKIQVHGEEVRVWQQGEFGTSKQTFRAVGASEVTVDKADYSNHNGWARLAVGEYPDGAGETGVTLVIAPQGSRPLEPDDSQD